MTRLNICLPDEAATAALGQRLANGLVALGEGLVVWLSGDLGAGKTAVTRAVLRGLGHGGAVVSPTYTLMEPYPVAGRQLLHLDLYRVADPEELEYLGLYDLRDESDWVFLEWAEQGGALTLPADVVLTLEMADPGRRARFEAVSSRGGRLLRWLQESSAIDGDTAAFSGGDTGSSP